MMSAQRAIDVGGFAPKPPPRAIVEVRFGVHARKRAVIEPGRALRVGRTELADLVVPSDLLLSTVHFELRWDGERCLLRDMGGAKGTLMAGQPVVEGEVPNGAWIRAGATDFSVYIEGHTPPAWDAQPFSSGGARARALIELGNEAAKGTLFAVLDAARDDRIQVLLRESVDEHDSLYQGVKAETMAEVAPYLVKIRKDSRLLPQLISEGWGGAWGIYLVCESPLRDVRAHLRKLLFVASEEDEEVRYFRFYDPRVLRIFMPTCTVRQEDELFGEIAQLLCEDEVGGILRIERTRRRAGGEA